VEREHRYGSATVAVYIDGVEASPALKSIRDGLQALKYVSIVKDRKMCQVQLRQVQGKVELLAADLSTLSPPVDASNKAGAAHMIEEVKSWAKYFNVLSLRNAASGIDLQFTLTGSQTQDPMARVGKPDGGVLEGESVEAKLVNNTERDLYVAILDLDSDGSINVVYPTEQGAKEVLTSGSTLKRSFTTNVAKGRSQATDILKVFASYKPIDLSSLTQEAVRGAPLEAGPPDPLQQLLNDSLGSTRGLAPQSTTLGTWTTVQRVLVVKRKGKG